ncbi:mucin-binding protein [Lactobacillus crispatus]|uniref:mucin-binding protein n=1 Tax=Lactobacillus crispatus TaxID=47770 RepID=UPI00356B688D
MATGGDKINTTSSQYTSNLIYMSGANGEFSVDGTNYVVYQRIKSDGSKQIWLNVNGVNIPMNGFQTKNIWDNKANPDVSINGNGLTGGVRANQVHNYYGSPLIGKDAPYYGISTQRASHQIWFPHQTTMEVTGTHTNTIKYVYSDGTPVTDANGNPIVKTQDITLTRKLTLDISQDKIEDIQNYALSHTSDETLEYIKNAQAVTADSGWTYTDAQGNKITSPYAEVVSPTVKGYTATIQSSNVPGIKKGADGSSVTAKLQFKEDLVQNGEISSDYKAQGISAIIPDNYETVVVYSVPQDVKDTLKFYDDATKSYITDAPDQTAIGKENDTVNFKDGASTVKSLEDKGYKFVNVTDGTPDDTKATILTGNSFDKVDFGKFGKSGKTFVVHLTHKVIPVTPDTPNIPSNSKITKDDLTKTATRTIHYVENGQNGAALKDPTVQTVTYSGTAYIDEVTGQMVNAKADGKDSQGNTTYVVDPDNKTTPSITWTTSNNGKFAQVTPDATINKDGQNWNTTVKSVNEENAPEVSKITGKTTNEDVYVPYTLQQKTYTGVDENKTVTRTIKYLDNETKEEIKGLDPVTQTTNLHRTQIKDEKGNVVGYGTISADGHSYTINNNWIIDNNGWSAQVSPDATGLGYKKTPHFDNGQDASTVPAGTVSVTDPQDKTVKVYYDHDYEPVNPDHPHDGVDPSEYTKDVNETVHYVYSDGTKAADDNVQTSKWSRTLTVDKVTGQLVPNGQYTTEWAIAKGQPSEYSQVNSPVIKGYYANQANVPATKVTQDDIKKTVTYKPLGHIIPVDPTTGDPIPNAPQPQFPNNPTDPTKGNPGEKPTVPGYHPQDGKPGEPVSPVPGNPGEDVKVPYVKDQGTVSVIFHDDTTNSTIPNVGFNSGDAAADTPVTYNPEKNISDLEKQGYVYVRTEGTLPGKVEANKNITVTVHMKHGVQPVTPTTPPTDVPKNTPKEAQPDQLTKKVNLTVNYVNADGTTFNGNVPANAKQTATFTGTAYVDKITGQLVNAKQEDGKWVINTDDTATPEITWTSDKTSFEGVTSPAEKGYHVSNVSSHADGDNVAAITGLTKDSQDITVTVTYAKNGTKIVGERTVEGSMTVHYTGAGDLTPKDNVQSGVNFHYTGDVHDAETNELVSKGHWEVNGVTGDSYQFNEVDSPAVSGYTAEVKVVPGFKATPDKPTFETTVNYTKNGTEIQNKKNVPASQTVQYVDDQGNVLRPEVKQNSEFQYSGDTVDKVTGETIKPGSWNETTHNFTAENVPVIKGYVAVSGYTNNNGKYTAGGFTATNTGSKEDNNKVFKVVYKKVGNLVPQDPNGNPIPDPKNPGQNVPNVPYTNDPTDPTKVTPNEKTPDIPGWHTDTPNVTPTDPTKDTPVVYTKNVENQNVTVKYFDDTKETDLSSYDKSISAKPGEALNYSTQPSITELENKGYKLVSDNFNVTTMPEKGGNYEVHFVHKTTTITPGKPGKPGEPINPNDPNGPKWPTGTDAKALTKQGNQTVHYVYADGTKAADDNVQNTTFAHTLVFDNVTGKQIEDKGWTPESHTFKDVTSPEIDGYHADKKTVAGATVTVNDPTSETTVIYAKNDTEIRNHQEVTASQLVKYVDEDGNELRASKNQNFTFTYTGDTYDKETGKQIATGKWNQTSTDFTSENVPVIDGYVAVKGYTRDDNDKVVAGGFTTSYDASDAKRNRTFTVVYKKVGKIVPVDPSKNPIPDAPTPSYENDPTDPTKVTPDEPTPNVPGYTPSQNTVTPPDPTKDTPVVYTKNVEQKAKVQYIDLDDNNKVMSESPVLTGQAGGKIDYSTTNEIANYEKQGYVLADDGFSNNPVFDNVEGNEQIFKVTFHHGQIPVNPDHPHDGVDPSKYTKDVKETVHYVDTEGNKVHDDNVQTSKWTRTLTVDAVTGKTIDNGQYTTDWSIAKGEKTVYDQVNTPVVDGYHADKREVPATAVTQDNIDVTVIYAKNGKIIPTDPSGKPIPNVPTPTYPTDPTDPTKVTPDEPVPDIPGLIPSKPTVTPTDPGKDTPVPYNPVIPAKDQAAVVNYIDSDEGNKVITTSGNLSGKAGSTIDYSTKSTIADLENKGYVLVNDGFPAGAKFDNDDNTTQIFTVVLKHGTVPVTPDKPGKPGEPINPNDPDGPKWPEGTDENSVKKTGTQTIHYVGAGENTPKDDVQTFDFTKKMVVDKVTGKIIDSGEWNVTSHTFGYKDTPVIDGYHADKRNAGGSVVTPDDLNKTVTVTYTQNGKIIPTDPSGKPIPNVPNPTYPTDPTDPTKVTPDEPVPDIPGMIPSKPTVTPTDPGKDTPVPYTPVTPVVNTVTGKITYIDDDATGNKILDVDNFSGKVGDKIDYTTAGEIQSYVNKGYVLVSNNFKDGDETFAKDGNVFEVHFKHGTTTVTPEKPGKPGEPIDPSNPEGPKYPAGTDEHAVKRTGTQTVHFTGAGDKTPADKKQSFDFTRKITFDNVTGKIITTTPWNEASHTFGYENVPVVDGFHTTVKTAGGTTVTPDDLDKTVTVNYSQNGKIIPVDPSGKPIPNAPTPTYPTDPTDPTKVVPNEPVPNIPGMVPSKNTVTPSDPGKDTPVIYNNGNTPVNPDTPTTPTTPTNPTTPTTPTTPDEPTNVTPHAETPETPSEPEKPSDDTNTVKPHAGVVPTSKKKSTTTTKTVTPHAQREVRITKNGNIINSKGHTIGYVDDKGQVHKTLPQTGDSAELAEAEAILGGIAAGLGLIGLAGSKKRRRN